MKVSVERLKPWGLKFALCTKKRALVAGSFGRVNHVTSMRTQWVVGLGWNLKEVETFQLFWESRAY